MSKYTEIDESILKAIQTFHGIPTYLFLAERTDFDREFISKRLKANPALARAQEEYGIAYINDLTTEELKNQTAKAGGLIPVCHVLPNLLARLYERIDHEIILPEIQDFNGIPTLSALVEPTGYDHHFISNRLQANPALSQAQEERGLAYINGLILEELKEQTIKQQGSLAALCQDYPGLLTRLYDRIDNETLLPAIQSFHGIPTQNALAEQTGYSSTFISNRLQASPFLAQAQIVCSFAYINGLTVDELREKTTKQGGLITVCRDSPDLLACIYERIDKEIILPEIRNSQRVPTSNALVESIGYSSTFISKRLQANPALGQAQEERGLACINCLTADDLREQTAKEGGLLLIARDQPKLIARLYDRIDQEVLLPAFLNFKGIPTSVALAKETSYGNQFILSRIEANPALAQAQDECGLAYINGLTIEEIQEQTTKQGGLVTECRYHPKLLSRLYERIDNEIILPVIQNFHGAPTPTSLAEPTGYSGPYISRRLKVNPLLFLAIAAKQGLTPDQAVELALERKNESQAEKQALAQRLHNLHAFREMVGLLRTLGHLFTDKKILDVSLYPDPLNRAAKELGLSLPIEHQSMQAFRQYEKSGLPKAETVVLQSIHRLASEALTCLFEQVHESLAGTVIATYSIRHAPNEGFLEALQANGFCLSEQGILRIDPPTDAELLKAGVSEDQLSKAQAKLSGSSNVLIFSRIPGTRTKGIPVLVILPAQENGREFEPADIIPLTLPAGLAEQLRTSFILSRTALPSAPFLLEVVSEKPVALIGFDMHPKQPNSLEVSTYPGSPAEDYHGFARRLVNSAALRHNLGIQPGQIKRIPIVQVRIS